MALSKTKRELVLKRDGHRCRWCRCCSFLTIDHITPKALGGTDSLNNLQALCEDCNQMKADGYYGTHSPFPTARKVGEA
jgi:5-methylcytosine-specific restriction endonuclease McrA